MDQHAVLEHLAAAAELEQAGADRGVVHPAQIAGQLLVGDAHGGGHRPELDAQELRVGAAHIRRVGELDVLAGFQDLQSPGLQAGECDALAIGRTLAQEGVLGALAGDEAGEHGRGLLAHQLGVVVLVELVQLDQGAGQPGLAADLPGAQGSEQVQDLPGVDAHRLQPALPRHRRQTPVLGMGAVEVVGHPTAKPIELDSGAHLVARGQVLVQGDRQVLGLQQLDLQGHRQPVLGPARPQPDQALAAFEHGPARQGLQPVEVGQPRGIGLLAPVPPQGLDRRLEALVRRRGSAA